MKKRKNQTTSIYKNQKKTLTLSLNGGVSGTYRSIYRRCENRMSEKRRLALERGQAT